MSTLDLMKTNYECQKIVCENEIAKQKDEIISELNYSDLRRFDGEYIARCGMRLAKEQEKLKQIEEAIKMIEQLKKEEEK